MSWSNHRPDLPCNTSPGEESKCRTLPTSRQGPSPSVGASPRVVGRKISEQMEKRNCRALILLSLTSVSRDWNNLLQPICLFSSFLRILSLLPKRDSLFLREYCIIMIHGCMTRMWTRVNAWLDVYAWFHVWEKRWELQIKVSNLLSLCKVKLKVWLELVMYISPLWHCSIMSSLILFFAYPSLLLLNILPW